MIRTPSGIQQVGACKHRAEVTVSSTAQEITLTAGYKSIEVVPAPDEVLYIYYGGVGVTSSNGGLLGAGKIWNNCLPGLSVYLVADGAETPKVRITEYRGGS